MKIALKSKLTAKRLEQMFKSGVSEHPLCEVVGGEEQGSSIDHNSPNVEFGRGGRGLYLLTSLFECGLLTFCLCR